MRWRERARLRRRLLPDAAHVVLGRVADDGQVHAPARRARSGGDSDTWAGLLRRYGCRTAAFYPPAVFFIDGERFQALHERGLDFEYRKEEFASRRCAPRRSRSTSRALPATGRCSSGSTSSSRTSLTSLTRSIPSAPSDIDRYDSEVATADEGIRAVVDEVRVAPGAVVIATADHGEEFGEHGGRYTARRCTRSRCGCRSSSRAGGEPGDDSVGRADNRSSDGASALGIPRPARLRGVTWGRSSREGSARGSTRDDPASPSPRPTSTRSSLAATHGSSAPGESRRARSTTARATRARPTTSRPSTPRSAGSAARAPAIASEHGRLEHGEEAEWPEALRRGIAGDADAALDVAALLDDANARIRARAAEVSFDLHVPIAAPAMQRALGGGHGGSGTRDETSGAGAPSRSCGWGNRRRRAEALLRDPEPAWRRAAALAFAGRGRRRGAAISPRGGATRGPRLHPRDRSPRRARQDPRPGGRPRARAVARRRRFRPFVADALAEIGDRSARDPSRRCSPPRRRSRRASTKRGRWPDSGAPRGPARLDLHVNAILDLPRGPVGRSDCVSSSSPQALRDARRRLAGRSVSLEDASAAPAFEFDAGADAGESNPPPSTLGERRCRRQDSPLFLALAIPDGGRRNGERPAYQKTQVMSNVIR